MYEVTVIYYDKTEDSMICTSKPDIDVEGGFVFIDGGAGQSLGFNIETFLKVKVKNPLPTVMPDMKYSINLNYNTETDDVELLFSPSIVYVSMEGEDDRYDPIIVVKEGDRIVRLLNSTYLKSIKYLQDKTDLKIVNLLNQLK